MKFCFFSIFSTLIFLFIFPQVNEFQKKHEIRLLHRPLDLNLDSENNIYIIMQNGQFMKLSFDQKLTFASSDLPLAMDWKISTNNPFKITLFSSSRQEMIVFDKQLALIAQYKFQFPFPLDVVKLSSQNTFLAWYSQAREFIEFHYPDYIIRKIRIPVEVLKNNLLRDIFELNGSFLLVQMEQILQVDFTGNLNTFFITPSDRVYVQDNTIIITTPYRINHFDKANEKLTYVVVLPNGKEWISNGKVAASYDNQILTVYTIPTKD